MEWILIICVIVSGIGVMMNSDFNYDEEDRN